MLAANSSPLSKPVRPGELEMQIYEISDAFCIFKYLKEGRQHLEP